MTSFVGDPLVVFRPTHLAGLTGFSGSQFSFEPGEGDEGQADDIGKDPDKSEREKPKRLG